MDKILIISPKDSDNIKSLSAREQLDKLSIAVNYQDINDNIILSYLFSQSYSLIVFNMVDEHYTPRIELLLDLADSITVNHTGTQGKKLLELLISLYPESEASLRKALLTRKNMFEVIGK